VAVTVVIRQDRVARHLRHDILNAVAGEPRDLVIDLRQVADLSSAGLATLVGVQARQRSRLKKLTLVCGERSGTQMALARTGMKGDFTVTEIPPQW
jgi:anti-anti-sigma regulatory factor